MINCRNWLRPLKAQFFIGQWHRQAKVTAMKQQKSKGKATNEHGGKQLSL
jgi:hypothetical protein